MAGIAISQKIPEVALPTSLAQNANAISNAFCELLDFMDQQSKPLRLGYRLELQLIPNGCRAKVKLDSVSWFDYSLIPDMGEASAAAAARKFIEDTRKGISNRPPSFTPQVTLANQTPSYCMNPDCNFGGNCKNGKHPNWCTKMIQRSNGDRKCGFFLKNELVLGVNINGHHLSARNEPTRDLLLTPVSHKTNSELARDPSFWQLVLNQMGILAGLARQPVEGTFEAVAFNMGKWETANSNDPSQFALDCHGHAHLLLTPAAFNVLYQLPRFRAALTGRFRDPDDHLEADCRELETLRLLGVEGSLLRADVRELKQDTKEMKQDMKGIQSQMAELLAYLKNK